jgi:hypothetical protein
MAKKEIYVCDYEYCGKKDINEEGGLPLNWFEVTIADKDGPKTFHICPVHELIISDPWGGSWVFHNSRDKENEPQEK